MNVPVSISITDRASEPLAAKIRALQPKRLASIVGPRVRELTRSHLAANGRNKKGWPSTGFWEDAARSTRWLVNDDGNVLISIDKIGVRQRYRGGPIRPRNVKALAIPIHPEAYGKTPKDFEDLVLIKTPKGAYLAQSTYDLLGQNKKGKYTRRGKGKQINRQVLTFLFKLSFGVDQDPDEGVIPAPWQYYQTTLKALNESVTDIVKGGTAT